MKHQIEYRAFDKEQHGQIESLYSENESKLNQYIERLLWWNQKVNLVSRDVSRETLTLHVKHCLTLSAHPLFVNAEQIIDAGTGGGMPGMPLALCFQDKKFVLNDIVKKKIIALKQIGKTVGALQNVEYSAESIEYAVNKYPFTLLISKHAFKINELIEMTDVNHAPLLLLKGREIKNELVGIQRKLKISIFDLFPEGKNLFYKGKAIVEINSMNEK